MTYVVEKMRQVQNKIYHGCLNKNKDGSNRLIKKDDKCFRPISEPFWKQLWDEPDGVRTRTQEKEQTKS